MAEIIKRFLDINVTQFDGNIGRMETCATILEAWVEAAEGGAFGDQYSAEDIEKTRRRAADFRSVAKGGSVKNAGLN